MPNLNLTSEEIARVAGTKKGVTFRTLAGNRLRCNQFPRLGTFGKKGAESLRRQVSNINRVPQPSGVPVKRTSPPSAVNNSRPQPRSARLDRMFKWVDCPWCTYTQYDMTVGQEYDCTYCGKPVVVV